MPFSPLRRKAFTLLELLVASSVSLILIGALLAALNYTSRAWASSRSSNLAFQTAANTFDLLTRSLSQAMLNSYWSYDDPALPQKYVRASELHFVLGQAGTLLSASQNTYPASAVFFQAPMGKTQPGQTSKLPQRLNALGYFTAFGSETNLPALLQTVIQPKYRYRLFQWTEPTDQLQVYLASQGNDWFTQALAADKEKSANVSPLGENIIGLCLVAEYPKATGGWERTFLYDSRSAATPEARNQLPPQLQVALVAIDEASAARLAARYGSSPPPVGPPEGTFEDPDKFGDDLAAWEDALSAADPPVRCRVFRTTIQIPNSRWSAE